MAINAEQNQLQKASQDNNKDSQAQPGQSMAGSGGTSSPQGRTASFSSGNQLTQGSGRFTNLKNYIGANQGAGERLAQGISKNIGEQTSGNKNKADTQASAVREGIQSAQGQIGKGTGYLNQVGAQDFNAEQFVADKDNLNEFGQFRTNQAVDAQGLQNNLNQAQQAGLGYQNQLQNIGQQVGTEQGRFGLLKDTFGGKTTYANPYSSGQQRLDQLFLQSGGGNQIQNLQSGIRSDLNKVGQNLAQVDQYGNEITDITGQAKTLADQLQGKTNELETGYITGLEGQVGGVNQSRADEQNKFKQFFSGITGKDVSQPLDQDILGRSGLQMGQQTFNVLNDPNLTAEQIMKFDPRTANSYKDIADQGNVNYYGALSQLAGITPDKLNQVGQLIDPTTGKLSNAASFVQGEEGLTGRIGAARSKLLGDTSALAGHGQQNSALFENGSGMSSGSRASLNAQSNVADYLRNLNASSYVGGENDIDVNRGKAFNNDALVDQMTQRASQPYAGYQDRQGVDRTIRDPEQLAQIRTEMQNTVNTAKNQADNQLKENALSYLGNQGFFNYLGANGAQVGDRDIAAYGYGGANAANPTGIYTPKNNVSK